MPQGMTCITPNVIEPTRVNARPCQGMKSSHSHAIGQHLKSRCYWPVCSFPQSIQIGFVHNLKSALWRLAADSGAIARHKAYLKSHPWKTASTCSKGSGQAPRTPFSGPSRSRHARTRRSRNRRSSTKMP